MRVMICASRRSQGFLPEDIGFASRFALILKQALVLKDEQDKLVQSGKLSALGQMSASLAHELRQPLNTISVAAQNLEMMAEKGPVASDVLTQKITRILAQVERASQIMDRIRRFSRKGGGQQTEADLTELAQGVRLLMEHVLMPAGVTLEIEEAGSGRDLLTSIVSKLLVLDDDTVVLPGHGEATTIGAERSSNPFLEGLSP